MYQKKSSKLDFVLFVKLHGFTAVASSRMFRRNPPKHTLLRQGFGGYPLLAFIHGLTPVAFCVGA